MAKLALSVKPSINRSLESAAKYTPKDNFDTTIGLVVYLKKHSLDQNNINVVQSCRNFAQFSKIEK